MKVPTTVSVFPAPTASLPDVSVKADWETMLLPSVAEPPPFIKNVSILLLVPGAVWLKNMVPSALVAPIVRLEVALPVKY